MCPTYATGGAFFNIQGAMVRHYDKPDVDKMLFI